MHKKYIGGIIGISLLAIISIIVVYSFNYSIAWQKDIDHNATSSFVDMLSLIITPAVTLIRHFYMSIHYSVPIVQIE